MPKTSIKHLHFVCTYLGLGCSTKGNWRTLKIYQMKKNILVRDKIVIVGKFR
jgi:predicted molibdopterin-dependent oxidoreductase YjgC